MSSTSPKLFGGALVLLGFARAAFGAGDVCVFCSFARFSLSVRFCILVVALRAAATRVPMTTYGVGEDPPDVDSPLLRLELPSTHSLKGQLSSCHLYLCRSVAESCRMAPGGGGFAAGGVGSRPADGTLLRRVR